ncbi:hypothetical protein [Ammoniphilus sp. 3BR4]|uniref:hypothetical protein n=1 Tax=Ammoniphilus sp. 3BR4 TaxID=3158265 RepID=UPI00346564D5
MTVTTITAGKAAKIPPILPPIFLEIREEAKTAVPPNRNPRSPLVSELAAHLPSSLPRINVFRERQIG